MGYVLVTVGTTKFVELVKELENEKILNLLKSQKYEKLYVQYGSGTPPDLSPNVIATECFDYKKGAA